MENEQALVRIEAASGMSLMPAMSIEQAIERRQMFRDFVREVMVEGVDYGRIPGTTKDTLLKPGAEKLCTLFGLSAMPDLMDKVEDWENGFFYFRYRYSLLRGDNLVAAGEGSCNSRETKYRWRKAERICPICQQPAIIIGKMEYGGGFVCFKKKGGCGVKFNDDDPKITSQAVGRVENEDVADLVNTLQKMAAKRALIAACLIATNASEFFTQDFGEEGIEQTEEAKKIDQKNSSTPRNDEKRSSSLPSNPTATTLADLITPKQIAVLNAMGNADGFVAEEQCQGFYRCHLGELSRAAASALIDRLKAGERAPLSQAPAVSDEAKPIPGLDAETEERARELQPLVQRENGHWRVGDLKIWRNHEGKVCCECDEFQDGVSRRDDFRCAHIWAVSLYAAQLPKTT